MLTKSAVFTDIHFGKSQNSERHNQDCIDYIKWFIDQATAHECDNIIFMGDWFENRSSINIHTLNYSQKAVDMLNAVGVPVYMIVGNHDCYRKHSRDIHSLVPYKELSNFTVVDEITHLPELSNSVLVPYLFHHEYAQMREQHLDKATWFGHFEFQGFVVTGHSHKMPTGPNPSEFIGPRIFSGHFHKRQTLGNITYIGNTFPTTYGDAGDNERGCMIYDHESKTDTYLNWEDCPKFQKIMLSTLLASDPADVITPKARVRCYADTEVDYETTVALKELVTEIFELKEFSIEDIVNLNDVARDTEVEMSEDEQLEDVDHLVVRLLSGINTDKIEAQKLVDIYNGLTQ